MISERKVLVWPGIGTPSLRHSKLNRAQPVAMTSNSTLAPAQTVALPGVGPAMLFGPRQRMADMAAKMEGSCAELVA